MTRDLPFLSLAKALERLPLQGENPDGLRRPGTPDHNMHGDRMIEAALKAVQTGFKHLSTADIAYPPKHWLDAALARQIAMHILIHQFGYSRRQLARELGRGRASMHRAVEIVDERLMTPEFARSYEEMADRARAEIEERE